MMCLDLDLDAKVKVKYNSSRSLVTKRNEETKKESAAAAFSRIHCFLHRGAVMVNFDELLIVSPTELNIPYELNKESSCSFQLTNKSDVLVGCKFICPWEILISPGRGTILPRSTCSFTVTKVLPTEPPEYTRYCKNEIYIRAFVGKDGVKAEDINENFRRNTNRTDGAFHLPVVYSYIPAANSSSAFPEKNGKGSLLDKDNFLLQSSNNKEMKRVENSPPPPAELVIPTTGGYGSTSRRKSEDTLVKPSFKPFSQEEIQDATNNFSQSLVIGEGGYGKVYKCQLDNWDVAVKILDDQGDQGLKEYIKEMEVLERMRHENLIHLMGTCFKFRALVYEYLPNGSLEDCLKKRPGELTWEIRTRIVYEICTALRFLHANKPEPLVHGDLKPHNVLLGASFKVKLADFGLCRYLTQGENSKAFRQTMHVSGSPGYMDPDFLGSLKVTPGVDVYSLGKTVVRILTGKHPPDVFREVYDARKARSFMSIVDPAVRRWPENVVDILARFALRSTKPDRNRSEFMRNFHSELENILDGSDN